MELNLGFCRVSTTKQNLERQVRNILSVYPNARIFKEYYTGTKLEGRREWNKIYNLAKQEVANKNKVTIIFDSVSRMSRNSEEGFSLYQELFNLGVNLVFLKEPHINTDTFKKALSVDIKMTGINADILLKAVKEYLMEVAKEQIKIAFDQAEKEVIDLHKRVSEGLLTAKLNGRQIGRVKGNKYITSKEKKSKELILKNSKDFNGSNNDEEVMKICGISKNTYYKYKRELKIIKAYLNLSNTFPNLS